MNEPCRSAFGGHHGGHGVIDVGLAGEQRLDRAALGVDLGIPAAVLVVDVMAVEMGPELLQILQPIRVPGGAVQGMGGGDGLGHRPPQPATIVDLAVPVQRIGEAALGQPASASARP